MHLLIAEDEIDLAEALTVSFEKNQFSVDAVHDGFDAYEYAMAAEYDAIILDVMMPQMDGWQVIKEIRAISKTPVIMLTARGEEMDKINGLSLGADDYITKPFSPLEMVARVKAQLRRARLYSEGEKKEADVLDFAGILIDRSTHTCQLNERTLNLTPTEFKILWLLCENRGKVLSCEELFRKVWGEKYFTNSSNTVMVHIRHLREKMGDATDKPKYIKTVWGVGYKIDG